MSPQLGFGTYHLPIWALLRTIPAGARWSCLHGRSRSASRI